MRWTCGSPEAGQPVRAVTVLENFFEGVGAERGPEAPAALRGPNTLARAGAHTRPATRCRLNLRAAAE